MQQLVGAGDMESALLAFGIERAQGMEKLVKAKIADMRERNGAIQELQQAMQTIRSAKPAADGSTAASPELTKALAVLEKNGFALLTLVLSAELWRVGMVGGSDGRTPGWLPLCGGTVLIRSGHACGRQRWRCKGCGRQFTRTEPRGKPAALKRHAIELYCLGLSMNAVAKRVGVSAQSMLRWVRDHARRHCPKPEPTGSTAVVEIDEVWHFVEKSPASSGSGRRSSAAPAG